MQIILVFRLSVAAVCSLRLLNKAITRLFQSFRLQRGKLIQVDVRVHDVVLDAISCLQVKSPFQAKFQGIKLRTILLPLSHRNALAFRKRLQLSESHSSSAQVVIEWNLFGPSNRPWLKDVQILVNSFAATLLSFQSVGV